MENISSVNSYFLLMGISEMGDFKFLFSLLTIVVYVMIMVLCFIIVFVTCTEEALHEPMYIFISNLMFNEMYGSTVFMPKIIIDLLTGCYIIPVTGCLAQGFFAQSFAGVEILTFTVMAYDRYLAVGHPLRYPMLMTNKTAMKILLEVWVHVLVGVCVIVILAARQTMCGVEINSMYCETISLNHLSCGDNTLSTVFGLTWTFILMVGSVLVVIYCYIGTFIVCFRISQEACQKAIHTLVTHIIAFSTFLASSLFIILRYKFKGGSLSVVSHIVTSVTGALSFALNPIIYGLRTEALRTKIMQKRQRYKTDIPVRGGKMRNNTA